MYNRLGLGCVRVSQAVVGPRALGFDRDLFWESAEGFTPRSGGGVFSPRDCRLVVNFSLLPAPLGRNRPFCS